ncbi:hypothetical protein MG293_017594 [Ovis ammon polii]|uniref:VWFA domain-containing protein n=1 Tax=Ovis ammon polii TaxID=230172 RepID=A0AAD4Y250_OVIAM|nr:hypothetical protein MG293_017594 [Ovis ammon polii]
MRCLVGGGTAFTGEAQGEKPLWPFLLNSYSVSLAWPLESPKGSHPLSWLCLYGLTLENIELVFKYKEYEKDVAIEEIDGLQLVKKLAKNMEEMFHKKSEAVRRLVEAAEEAHLKHEFDADLQIDYAVFVPTRFPTADVSEKSTSFIIILGLRSQKSICHYQKMYEYFNAVLINERDKDGNFLELGKEFILAPNDHFNNLPVNISLSDVQVPTNMYNKDPAIVNGVYWSESLNKVFVDNFDRDPSLIWQYFGSAKGFFRQYPGIKWEPDENGVIAFDCRNRKWYIQAATSPKDVVILVDVSGSMKGLRMTIAKQTVSSILDTLGDDDFFNIIAYNEELHYVEPCLNGTLVQADRTNKEHFREHLDKLFAKGIGMLDIALNEAFNILSDFNHTGQGSICSQAIMLITDGAVDTYDTIFAKYNWPDRKVNCETLPGCAVQTLLYVLGVTMPTVFHVKSPHSLLCFYAIIIILLGGYPYSLGMLEDKVSPLVPLPRVVISSSTESGAFVPVDDERKALAFWCVLVPW